MKKAATIIYGVEFLIFLALVIVLACLQGMSELVVVLIVVISVSAFGFLLMLGLMNEHPTGAAIICLVFFDIFGLVPAILLFIENDRLKQERAVALKKENQNKEELANERQEKMLIDQYKDLTSSINSVKQRYQNKFLSQEDYEKESNRLNREYEKLILDMCSYRKEINPAAFPFLENNGA